MNHHVGVMGKLLCESISTNVDRSPWVRLPIALPLGEHRFEARAYRCATSGCEAIVLVNNDKCASDDECLTTRIHSGCLTGDVFHSLRCDCRAQLQTALERIASTANAALIYLPYQEGRGIGLFDKIRAYAMQDLGLDTVDANLQIGAPIDAREYDLAAQIIRDLGFSKVRLLTNNPSKTDALSTQGIEVVEQVPLIVPASCHNEHYLDAKRRRLHHNLPPSLAATGTHR